VKVDTSVVMELSKGDLLKLAATGRMVLFDADGNPLREFEGVKLPGMDEAVTNALEHGKRKTLAARTRGIASEGGSGSEGLGAKLNAQ
jgi:hypothetical protein